MVNYGGGADTYVLAPTGDLTGAADPARINAASTALSAGGGGSIALRAGTYWIGSALAIPNNVWFRGAGQGVTILKATSVLGGPIFKQVIPSGGSIFNVGWRDLTLDGNTGPAGANIGILIDTSALNSTPYYNVKAENTDFQNCLIGWQHSANNFNGGALNNETLCINCRFFNNGTGAALRGVYASTFSECLFAGNTVNAIGTSGYNGTPVIAGSDPATSIAVRGCHFEGLGNLTGAGSATESGVSLNCTQFAITDCYFSNISRFPIQCQDNEGIGSVIDGIRMWGSGGTAIILEGNQGPLNGFTAISNVAVSAVSQNTGLVTAFGQRGVIAIAGGAASISNVTVNSFAPLPPYALNLGADGNGKVGIVDVSQFHFPAPTIAWLTIQNTQGSMTLKIRGSAGYNPQGTLVIAVPATGVATAAQNVDTVFYVAAAAGGQCTFTASGGPTVTVAASAKATIVVPAGTTMTPVFGAGNAPTWQVHGL